MDKKVKIDDMSEGRKAVNVATRAADIASSYRLPRNSPNCDETIPDSLGQKNIPEFLGWGAETITGSGDGRPIGR